MGIDIILQNQIHERIELIYGDAWGTFAKLVDRAPVGSMLWQIHEHADTMYNMAQLALFLDELADLSPNNDEERELLSALRNAAEIAIRRHGYLWFSGD
ncbi:hypothetical protein [Nocardia nepalensis]|uniref:hypothetical protein n=1 Tax=Nocardia nepalensis TaxID=3375448 RepID=UPI003B674CDF